MKSHLQRISNWESLAEEAKYRVHDLAKVSRSSLRQLERFFQDKWHTTPKPWLLERQLTKAAELLKQGLPIKAIAHSVGFKQSSQFYREFKRFYRVTPFEFLISRTPIKQVRAKMSRKAHRRRIK